MSDPLPLQDSVRLDYLIDRLLRGHPLAAVIAEEAVTDPEELSLLATAARLIEAGDGIPARARRRWNALRAGISTIRSRLRRTAWRTFPARIVALLL